MERTSLRVMSFAFVLNLALSVAHSAEAALSSAGILRRGDNEKKAPGKAAEHRTRQSSRSDAARLLSTHFCCIAPRISPCLAAGLQPSAPSGKPQIERR